MFLSFLITYLPTIASIQKEEINERYSTRNEERESRVQLSRGGSIASITVQTVVVYLS